VASPCLWGKLHNLSFSKVSKRRRGSILLRSPENGRKKVGKNQGKLRETVSEHGGKWRKIVKKNRKLEEKMNGKLGKPRKSRKPLGK